MHQIKVPPSKRAVSATLVQSSKRTVADRHRLAAQNNKAASHISRVNCVEITGDRPREPANKIFSIKRNFNSASFDP